MTFESVKGHAGHPRNEAADSGPTVRLRRTGIARRSTRDRVSLATTQKRHPLPRRWLSPTPPAASGAVAVEQPTLFDDLDDDATEIRITLTASEHARLRERASTAGISPEQFLRELI